jgi:hypothetical protein
VNKARTRLLTLATAVAFGLAAVVDGEIPAMAHSNTCAAGSSNFVVIVFEHASQGGANDDVCYISTHSFDEAFSVNEVGVDDIGENANFHDIVSSMSVKNFGGSGLCVRYYRDAFRQVLQETQWVGAGQGDIHFNAAVNDSYDSLDLLKANQSSCFG